MQCFSGINFLDLRQVIVKGSLRIIVAAVILILITMVSCSEKKKSPCIREFHAEKLSVSVDAPVFLGASDKKIGRVVYTGKNKAYTFAVIELEKEMTMGISSAVNDTDPVGVRIIPTKRREAGYRYIALFIEK